MARLTAEGLFSEFFLPLYPEDARADLARARSEDANPGKNPTFVAHLREAAERFAARAPLLFDGMDLRLDGSDASVHRLSAALTPERRDAWASRGAVGTADNELFNAVIHGAAYVGECIVRGHGGTWCIRRPLWESLVRLESRAGIGHLAVFHWWLKSLADGTTSTLADRYRTHVEVPDARPEQKPLLVAPDRKLPRLSRPRYDLLYKYLRAHLPEIKDLGADFPSPERFEAFGFSWIEPLIIGGGRMVLLRGQSQKGVFLAWIGAEGFEKSVFYPADPFPEHIVRLEEDILRVFVSVKGETQVHEMLWWGP